MRRLAGIALGIVLASPAPSMAGESRYTAGLDGGFAAVTRDAGSDTPVFLAFHAGWQVHERLNLGISAGGLLLQPANTQDPEPGRGISELMATASWRPLREYPAAWLEAAAGRVTYWNNPPALPTNLQGACRRLSAGLDTWQGAGWRSGPFLAFEQGDAGAAGHRAWVMGLRMQWLFGGAGTGP